MDTFSVFKDSEGFEIFAYLEDTPNAILNLEQKGILYQAWLDYEKMPEYEELVKKFLGDEFTLFTNYLVEKMNRLEIGEIFLNIEEFNPLREKEYEVMLSYIIKLKLGELKDQISPKGFTVETKENFFGDVRYISYVKKATHRKYELLRLDLVFDGFKYLPKVYLFDMPEEQTHLLTEQSIKNLKALMYSASETKTADFKVLDKGLKALEFKTESLNLLKDELLLLE